MEHPTGTIWHVGRTVGRTIYQGDGPDDLIGIMDTRELAALVVAAVNAYRATPPAPPPEAPTEA